MRDAAAIDAFELNADYEPTEFELEQEYAAESNTGTAETRVYANGWDVVNKGIKNTSTVAEYHAACLSNRVGNSAISQIEAGNEPHLVHLDSLEMGLHPLIPVYDTVIKVRQDGFIGLALSSRTSYVPPDTILAWR